MGHSLRSGLVELHLEVFGEAETGQVRDPHSSCEAFAEREALAHRPGAGGASLGRLAEPEGPISGQGVAVVLREDQRGLESSLSHVILKLFDIFDIHSAVRPVLIHHSLQVDILKAEIASSILLAYVVEELGSDLIQVFDISHGSISKVFACQIFRSTPDLLRIPMCYWHSHHGDCCKDI